MLSELIKEEGDCVVTVLHKILQHSKGRETGSADDASIMLANLDKTGLWENNKPMSLFLWTKVDLGGATCHFKFSTRHIPKSRKLTRPGSRDPDSGPGFCLSY